MRIRDASHLLPGQNHKLLDGFRQSELRSTSPRLSTTTRPPFASTVRKRTEIVAAHKQRMEAEMEKIGEKKPEQMDMDDQEPGPSSKSA